MRLWSVHPSHLDAKGLVALWREGLLARHVLKGLTRGYRNHPQLSRFRAHPEPEAAIEAYLGAVVDEATERGYSFDRSKIDTCQAAPMRVTDGQVAYEWAHLLAKLAVRDPAREERSRDMTPRLHPSFALVTGPIEDFERARP